MDMERITVAAQVAENMLYDWSVVSNNNTLITSDLVKGYLGLNYGDFYCAGLWDKWQLYNGFQAADLEKALNAWNDVYNPVSNYDKHEKTIDIENHGKETIDNKVDENHNSVTTAALENSKSQHKTTTADSQTPRLEYEDSNQGGTITTNDLNTKTEKERANTTLTYDNTTYTGHDIHIYENNTEGNIGTMTAQSMVLAECELRLNPVIKQYIDRFVYQYCIYVGGAWL